MKTILVTGGAGFIGSNLCEKLLVLGYKVLNIDNFNDFYDPKIKRRNVEQAYKLIENNSIPTGNYELIEGDIRNKQFLRNIFLNNKVDIIVHLAAYAGVRPSIQNPELYMDVNINGSVNILECAKEFNIKKILFASSSSVYGNNSKVPFAEEDFVDNPISPYAASKKAGELICHTYHHLYGFSIACLRFFTVFGPRQRPDLAIHKFAKLITEGKAIPFYGDGSTERDYTYIEDILDGITKAIGWVCNNSSVYGIFNLGESNTISLKEMVDTLEATIGKKAILNMMPMQPGDVKRTNADITKAKSVLGYSPSMDFKKGIEKFIEWYNLNNQ